MGGSGSQSQSSSPPTIPQFLYPILGGGISQYTGAESTLPSMTQQYGNVPLQGTAQLTPFQNQDIGGFQSAAASGGVNPYQNQTAANFNAIANPTVEQQAFSNFAVPQTEQAAVLAGQGTSGALPYDIAQAAIPYQLGAVNTELNANQGLAGLGQNQVQNQQQQLGGALNAAGEQQSTLQNALNSLFNRGEQQWNYGTNLQTYPLSLLGETIGGGTTTVGTGSKF